jgi:ornithine cyclodeaminase/alanine dehydrogenase-like protein (mu-crystallin family)
MKTLILSDEDVRSIALQVGLDALMDELIRRLTSAFESFSPHNTLVPARDGFLYEQPHVGLLEWMPCMTLGGRATIKVVSYHPANTKLLTLPTILSTIGAYDTSTGHLECLMDGTLLTAIRTGAASAVATGLMAAPESTTLGMIGTGAQAVTQLHALSRILDLREVLIYDLDPEAMASFPDRARTFSSRLPIRPASLERIVSTADVICTATSVGIGEGPVFDGFEPKPWAHFNAVGSDFPGKIELPADILRRSFVCPDFRDQAIREGECQQLDPDAIGPNLYEVVQRQESHGFLRHQLSVFDSTGWALEDHVALHLFMEYATELGLGVRAQVESIPEDAVNPYHFARNGVPDARRVREQEVLIT